MAKEKIFNGILFLGFLFSFFMPGSLQYIPSLSFLAAHAFWLQFSLFAVSLVLTLMCNLSNLRNRVFAGTLVLLLTECVACLVHRGDYSVLYHHAVKLLTVYLFVGYAMKQTPHLFLRVAAWYFTILIVINLVFLFLKPDGLGTIETYSSGRLYRQFDRMNFLEVDNRLSMPIGMAIISSALLIGKDKKYKTLLVIAMAVSVMTNLVTRSGTGTINAVVLVGYTSVFFLRGKIHRMFNLFNLFVLYALIMVIIVFAPRIPLVQSVVHGFLGKDMTFSGRTEIWDYCLEYIGSSPVFGLGNAEEGWTIYWHGIGRNAHNLFFDVMYEGGLVMFVGYLFLLGTVLTKVASAHTRNSQLMLVFLFSIYVIMLCESFYYNNYMYLFYAIACCPVDMETRDARDRKLMGGLNWLEIV